MSCVVLTVKYHENGLAGGNTVRAGELCAMPFRDFTFFFL